MTADGSRDQLIATAASLCAEDGYARVKEEAIAVRAGVSLEELEGLFPGGKEECALAAVDTILAQGMAAVGEGYSADRSESESVLIALRALLDLFASRPAFARLAFIDSRQSMSPEALQRYQAGFSILNAMLDRLRSENKGSAEVPATAARAAIGGGEALIRREIASGRALELPRLLPALVYAATAPFLGQEEALQLTRQAGELLAEEF
jgi:AcrR family transcriptional regulator